MAYTDTLVFNLIILLSECLTSLIVLWLKFNRMKDKAILFVEIFGWCGVLTSVLLGAFLPWVDISTYINVENGIEMILIMQIGVSAFLVYASRLKRFGIELGDKLYPASFASFVLYVLIAQRWLNFSG